MLAVGAASLAVAAAALAATGDLTQKPGTAGCVSETGTAGACQDGTALDPGTPFDNARGIAVSPDGKSVYVASGTADAVAIFDRDATSGALTQKPGTAGCVSETGTGGACQDGTALDNALSVAVSPDGKSVYAASAASDAVAIFDRDTTSGALAQKPAPAGCVSETGTGGACQDGTALDAAAGVAVSPDGKSVYVAAINSAAVAILDRDATTGALAQKPGTAGCVSNTGTGGACQDGTALVHALGVAVSPDGKSVYVASTLADAVAILDRDATSGELTQKPSTAGCVSEDGTGGACQDGTALAAASGVAVSPDGMSVYVASLTSDAVAILDRNSSGGALAQKAGTAGCVSETGTGGACQDGTALDNAVSIAAGPDGKSVYVASTVSDAVAILDRDATNGALTQKPSTAGCVSETGTAGACQDGTALDGSGGVTVSPDGKSVYVAALVSGAVAIFDRDTTSGAPETQIGSGPAELTNDATPTFTFSSQSGTSFACRVDGDGFAACSGPSASHTTATLADGAHAFEVRARDAFGTVDSTPAQRSFTVDASAPETTITSGPSGPTDDPTPGFAFSSDDAAATFECELDGDAFGACSGPGVTDTGAALADGSHTFRVRASDPAGNQDPTPAERSFSVDTALADLELAGKKVQRFRRAVAVRVSADEACTVLAKGTVELSSAHSSGALRMTRTLRLRPDTEELAAGQADTLKLKARRKARRTIVAGLERGRRVVATVRLTATDQLGNAGSAKRTVRLTR